MEIYSNEKSGTFGKGERMLLGALIGGFAGAAAIFVLAVRSMNRARDEIHMEFLRSRKARAAGLVQRMPARDGLEHSGRTAGNMKVQVG